MTPLDHATRLEAIRRHLDAAPYDHLLLTGRESIRWLTGFTGSNGWVLVTPDDLAVITDGRYGDQAAAELAAAGVDGRIDVGSTRRAMTDHLARAAGSGRPGARLGFEGAHISYAEHASLSESVAVEWIATSGVVEESRRTKDRGEIERMERASDIADVALAVALPFLHSEPTEAQFRDTLEAAMRQHGADGPSFDTIIAAGPNAALPHHHPDDTRIVEGMTVVIDFGALYDGYHSDMTRTFTIGDPTPLQAEVYGVVLDAQLAGVAGVRSGAGGRALDGVCRDSIAGAGWGDWFTHGTGHGVGLQIHESPWLTQSYDDTLRVADVVTVEPGVYRKDFGGVRIEDMVVVTTDGCLPLTKTPKDSPCLPSPPTT
ncbi:MAG: Xaa-Pro aminopeptidase [Ilumatobacteraceae bacterium]|nr:Xaa-Pro aminopeptidase [Ilumatobacteraceae bacterium]